MELVLVSLIEIRSELSDTDWVSRIERLVHKLQTKDKTKSVDSGEFRKEPKESKHVSKAE